ncbi:MAG: hypothetical protein KME26_19750 [Oscillatoria princeps RMCB-10]|nr:hypothetical protein [Oscillatoria princeps RMCB-10]
MRLRRQSLLFRNDTAPASCLCCRWELAIEMSDKEEEAEPRIRRSQAPPGNEELGQGGIGTGKMPVLRDNGDGWGTNI